MSPICHSGDEGESGAQDGSGWVPAVLPATPPMFEQPSILQILHAVILLNAASEAERLVLSSCIQVPSEGNWA